MLLHLEGFLGSLLNLSELYTTATAATARWILFGSTRGRGGGFSQEVGKLGLGAMVFPVRLEGVDS
jgi:hypothetical protein